MEHLWIPSCYGLQETGHKDNKLVIRLARISKKNSTRFDDGIDDNDENDKLKYLLCYIDIYDKAYMYTIQYIKCINWQNL